MAVILEFRRTEEAVSRITKPVQASLGEIIIFPGVRIDRRASGDSPRQSGASSGRRTQRARKKS
jgi:hypothetical protein